MAETLSHELVQAIESLAKLRKLEAELPGRIEEASDEVRRIADELGIADALGLSKRRRKPTGGGSGGSSRTRPGAGVSIYASLPIAYQGSHIVPSLDSARGGAVDIALIPGHIAEPERDDDLDLPPLPFLRLGVYGANEKYQDVVVLDRAGVELVHRTLGEWLEATDGGA